MCTWYWFSTRLNFQYRLREGEREGERESNKLIKTGAGSESDDEANRRNSGVVFVGNKFGSSSHWCPSHPPQPPLPWLVNRFQELVHPAVRSLLIGWEAQFLLGPGVGPPPLQLATLHRISLRLCSWEIMVQHHLLTSWCQHVNFAGIFSWANCKLSPQVSFDLQYTPKISIFAISRSKL